MKTNIPSLPLRILSAAFLVFALSSATLRANDDGDGSTASVKLSAPGKPSTLRIDMPWADIHIVAVDGDTVTVASTLEQKGARSTRPGGLRRLDDEVSFELVEHDNVVSLRLAGDNPWAGHDAEFKISVPRAMALDLKTDAGGDLIVEGSEGDITATSMNGDVVLKGISGSTIVNTMNGEVRVIYAKAPQKPVDITSMNGEIDLRVPAETKANVRMSTHNGSILTDFDENVLKTKSENKGSSHSYAYGIGESAHIRADAARMAADASRMAQQVAREVSREVKRETERAVKEATEPTEPTTPATPRAPRAPRVPMPPITGGKIVSGSLNGGGVDIKISTMNGEITLRQTK